MADRSSAPPAVRAPACDAMHSASAEPLATPRRRHAFAARMLALPAFETSSASTSGERLDAPVRGADDRRAYALPGLPARYAVRGLIDTGGSGEVYLVWDAHVESHIVVKVLRQDFVESEWVRIHREGRAASRLNHPGIVPVLDRGQLGDGRVWLAMLRVQGHTLHTLMGPGAGDPPLDRQALVRLLLDACEAVGFAHSRQIIHRDIKPNNLMVETESGQLKVIDWGLARFVGEAERGPQAAPRRSAADPDACSVVTHEGAWLGTPAYMSPEQACGQQERVGAPSDVYSLGVVLHEVLTGRRPIEGDAALIIERLRQGELPPLHELARRDDPLSRHLTPVCRRALSVEPRARYADADAMARALRQAIERFDQERRAMEIVRRADALLQRAMALRARATDHEVQAQRLRRDIHPFDPESAKHALWHHEDEAARLWRRAALDDVQWEQELHSALVTCPDLALAHRRLADYARERLLSAEQRQHWQAAVRFRALLERHDDGRYDDVLRGEASVSLSTAPAGVEVEVARVVERHRRLVPDPATTRLRTPFEDVRLPAGSHVLTVRFPDGPAETHSIRLGRGERWCYAPPDAPTGAPMRPAGAVVAPDEALVPAGWCTVGGDDDALDGLPRQRIWLDGFVMRCHPVTHRAYLDFLNALIDAGEAEQARRYAPRMSGPARHGEGADVYRWRPNGGVELADDGAHPLHPVSMVDWHAACAYARWLGQREGLPWRLPHEWEFEKAARGADERRFPWGNYFDPVWTNALNSHDAPPTPCRVDATTCDVSPYGVRWLGGNVRTWCINPWQRGGPTLADDGRPGRPIIPTRSPDFVSVRGGAWAGQASACRSASRFGNPPSARMAFVGIRLVREV